MYSQSANTDFANQMNSIFQHLDKNRVPHGILTDFGLDYVDLSSYSGSLSTNNYTSRATVHESFYDLISSRIRQVNTGFIQPQEFEKRWHNHRTERVITLGGLYFKYAKFKDNAKTSGKINVTNNKIYDVYTNGIWQNPYEEKSTFILAPSINSYKGLNFQVKLPQDIFLSNYPSQIQSIAVDFQDGQGYRTVNYNQIINVSYTQANTYTWKFKLTLTNGQTLYSHSKIEIEEGLKTKDIASLKTSQTPNPPTSNTTQGVSDFDGYYKTTVTASVPYYGKYATATLYIKDVGAEGITKPLIVAEGFDTGAILNPEQEAGDNNIIKFLNNVNTSSSNLPSQINTYDIIYVDWDNGVDFIQRNAFAFEEAIRYVNDNKLSDTPNTIIGQSMGGLVARYALADIEQNRDFNHDTNLYISHDAPHLGANTPIGMQHMYRHVNNMYQSAPLPLLFGEVILPLAYDASGIFGDTVISVFGTDILYDLGEFVTPSQYLSISDFPASRQMLYNWVNMDYEIKNVIHDAWQQELSDMGYPQGDEGMPIRNIAIANGSECGVEYTHDTSLIRYEKTAADKTILNSIIGLTDIGVGIVLAGTWQGAALMVLGVLPGNSKYDIIFNASAMTSLNENKQIYYGRITYKKKILWVVPISVNLTREEKHQPNGIFPYDSYGGGAYTIENYLGDLFNTLPTLQNNGTFGRYGFIPTASALDAGRGITSLDDMDYKRDYVGANPPSAPKDSPFHNFVTHFNRFDPSNTNSEHISFNRINGNWLVTELDDSQTPELSDCSAFCINAEISGEDILCTTGVYSVTNLATIVNWSVIDPDNLVSFTSNGNEITLNQLNPDNYGIVTLEVYYYNPRCGSITVTKDIEVGILPNRVSNASLTGETSVCDNQQYTYYISGLNHPCVNDIEWTVSDNLNIISHTANSVTVTSDIYDDEYAGLITANLPNSSFTIEKGVWVGIPNSDNIHIQKIGAYDLYAGRWSKLKASYQTMLYPANGPLNLTFEWQIPNSAIRFYDDSAFVDVKPYNPGQLNVGVRAICPCGNSNWKYELFNVDGPTNTLIELRKAN
ncbi:MAG: hypothetical protein CMO82_14030 [Winogradskyella sp.]|nr:hypothetical protein [Winogradskyella sp.]|tara:strand:- start:1370 stop:4561 length:3192 start_codon:yes stop_codon:yes gene_type:complete